MAPELESACLIKGFGVILFIRQAVWSLTSGKDTESQRWERG